MQSNSFSDLYRDAEDQEDYWVAGLVLELTESITEIMSREGVSRSELARRLGTSPAYVTKILRGNANFTLATMVRLVRAVGAELRLDVVTESRVSGSTTGQTSGTPKGLAAAPKDY